jgi:signal transduction histidine kinase
MSTPRALHRGVEALVLCAVYVGVARLGLKINAVSGFATFVWPASGIALTALLLRGQALWPGVALGAFLTNLSVGAPAAAALGIACGNTLEAVAGAWALKRWAGLDGSFERLRHVAGLLLLGALASTLLAALIGVGSLWAAGKVEPAQLGATFRAWWIGDALGELTVAPLLLAFAGAHPRRWLKQPGRILEALLLAAALSSLSWLVFGGRLRPDNALGQVYLLFPVLVWAALRFQLRGATAATLLVSAVAVSCTVRGNGPFVHDTVAHSLLFLQLFMAMAGMTTLVLAAAVLERDRALRARDSVLAVVSHDLKNPINAIGLHAQMLGRKLRDDEAATKLIKQMERSADRMGLLVSDLLDVAALEAGQLTLELTPVDGKALVAEAAELLRAAAEQRGQTLRTEAPDGAVWARCDRARVLQVLLNLGDNAVKFSPEGAAIALSARRDGEVVRFSVSDQGPGISAAAQERIFDAFWRGDTHQPGTGLGLAIASHIVEAHGGELWVESAPGKGSTFCFELPATTETK